MCNSQRIASTMGFRVLTLCLTAIAATTGGAVAGPVVTSPGIRPGDAFGIAASPSKFFVAAYDVEGAKRLDQADVEAAVYPFLGPGKTRADMQHAADALRALYQSRGLQTVIVDIPAQPMDPAGETIVRIHVLETPVGRLRVLGAHYYDPELIRRQAPALAETQMPDIAEAGREIAQINRLPGRQVEPVLHAGKAPGTVDVDLRVTDTFPAHASVELSNDHNQNTDPLRVTGTIRYDNLWQLGHSASFTYAVAPTNRRQSEIFAGSYLAPVWGTPWSVLVFGYDSNSNVATLGGTNVLGKGYSVGVRAVDQLPRIGDLTQSLSFGADYKNFLETLNFASTATPVPDEYWPLDLSYTIARDGARFSTKAALSLTAGVRGLGSNTATFENARAFARPEFIHVNLDLTQTENLKWGFQASQHLVGQIADGPLVSSEQFSVGGLSSVRGYLQSEAVADEGLSGGFELLSPALNPKGFRLVDEIRLYAFDDGAAVWSLQPLHGQTQAFTLESAGVGLRVTLLRHLKGDVALGVPLIAASVTRANHPRVTFSLKSDF